MFFWRDIIYFSVSLRKQFFLSRMLLANVPYQNWIDKQFAVVQFLVQMDERAGRSLYLKCVNRLHLSYLISVGWTDLPFRVPLLLLQSGKPALAKLKTSIMICSLKVQIFLNQLRKSFKVVKSGDVGNKQT